MLIVQRWCVVRCGHVLLSDLHPQQNVSESGKLRDAVVVLASACCLLVNVSYSGVIKATVIRTYHIAALRQECHKNTREHSILQDKQQPGLISVEEAACPTPGCLTGISTSSGKCRDSSLYQTRLILSTFCQSHCLRIILHSYLKFFVFSVVFSDHTKTCDSY